MFGFLKNLVKKSADSAPPPAPSPAVAAPKPASTSTPAAPTPPSAPVEVQPVSETEERLEISYKTLAGKLPEPVQKIVANRSGFLRLPISIALAQLPRGEVKVTLGQLAQYSTAGSVVVPPDQANTTIPLPLGEILSKLKPEQLNKRTAQKKMSLAEDIPDVFGKGAKGIVAAPLTTPASAFPPAAPSAPSPAQSPAPVSPVVPQKATESPRPSPSPTASPAAASPAASPAAPGVKTPATESVPIKTSVVLPPPTLKPSPTPSASPAPKAAPQPSPAIATAAGAVAVPMSMMTSHFAALGKTELANLHQATIQFPEAELEAALKQGKAIFPWKSVKNWIQSASALPSLDEAAPVEFPLHVIAPIFLQSRRTVKPQKKLELTEDIPDLFARPAIPSGFTQTADAPFPPAAPETPKLKLKEEPAPSAAPAPLPPEAMIAPVAPPPTFPSPGGVPAPKIETTPPSARPVMGFGDIFGVPSKKEWTLNEVVQKCVTLRGVAGAVITTEDGLLVAGVWPDGVKTESAAAFMPQMFSRVAQYSRELNLGDPNQFTLLIENVPLQIFRAGNNFFTVLGKAGEPLPKVQLTALAMRLSQDSTRK